MASEGSYPSMVTSSAGSANSTPRSEPAPESMAPSLSMRLWTRFGVVAGSLLMLVAATMPWMHDVRPIQVPTSFLIGHIPDSGITGAGLLSSVGLPMLLASFGALFGGLYGRRMLSAVCGVGGSVLWVLFFLQVMYQIGSLQRYEYGATVALLGVLITSVSALAQPAPVGYVLPIPFRLPSPLARLAR